MSHYDTLGVDKTATQDEIKKAYRKLSKQYHPDMSSGDETKFKQIAEAYDVIGDPQKRQQYDMRGSGADFFNQFNFGDRVDMSSIFDQMFGGGFNQNQQKGQDLRVEMRISFEEAFKGTSKNFSINGHNISMTFKPGLKTGQKFRISGKGQPHPFNSNLPNGDIIVNVEVQPDLRFILNGNDIWIERNLPWYDIMIGCKTQVASPDGLITITVPAGTHPGKTLRIKDKGFPIYNTNERGALMCRINAVYPELNLEAIEYIDKVKNILDAEQNVPGQ